MLRHLVPMPFAVLAILTRSCLLLVQQSRLAITPRPSYAAPEPISGSTIQHLVQRWREYVVLLPMPGNVPLNSTQWLMNSTLASLKKPKIGGGMDAIGVPGSFGSR